VIPTAQLAFIFPSGQEMIVLLVVGIMLFGRRLPQVGRTIGRTVVQLRQGFHKLQAEMDLENEVRDVADTLRGTRDELTREAGVPQALRDPGRMLKDLTDETLSSVVPDRVLDDVPHDLFEMNGELDAAAVKTDGS
jgi:Sec-independent protein translocase protein TatA